MADVSQPSAFPVPELEARELQELAALLTRVGYGAAQEMRHARGPAALEDSPGRLLLLRRLFWRGEALTSQEAAEALAPLKPAALLGAGLLQETEGLLRGAFQIQVYDGLYFIADFMPPEHPADLVLPIGPSGKYLAEMTIRTAAGTALDLGCGCGIQSLLLSRHARQVTATDINPRALAMTLLNAGMNGISNVETMEGSYFEPIKGRAFDLLVANLPYVITPEQRHVYRDLGRADDLPIRQSIEQAPRHLNEGGYAQVMLNWIHEAKQAWWQPIEEWTRGRGVDSWLLYSRSQTAEQYTKQWLTLDEGRQPDEYARTRQAWLEWYEAKHIERIGFGTLSLRRRSSGHNWRCSVHIHQTASEPLGKYVQHLFETQDYLGDVRKPADLLGRRLRPHLMKVEASGRGRWRARTTRGFLIRESISWQTARTLEHLDEATDLMNAIRKARVLHPWSGLKTRELICDEIHRLMNVGMIVPA